MNKFKNSFARWFIVIAMVLCTFETVAPPKVQAQWLTSDLGNLAVNAISSIENVYQAVSSAYLELKETVLDPLAWMLGKQILQALTSSVVDWINTGFEGNPSFIQNPTGFFLDVADQYTGAFIDDSGPLKDLCEPFNIDLRADLALQFGLNLGLGAPATTKKRYTCTLSTIITNVQNAKISGGANITVNGSSVGSFMDGDFSQGGWPAFIAMTTVPQNNYMGASISAQADLDVQIADRKASIKDDILAGGGFMSYKKCKPLGTDPGNDPNATPKYDDAGFITWESCHTETPGSTISAALNKHLGAGSDSLVAADEIDEILSAAFNQLIKKVLQEGLGAASKPSPTGSPSITSTLKDDVTGLPTDAIATAVSTKLDKAITDAEQYQSIRQDTLDLILAAEAEADSAYSQCYPTYAIAAAGINSIKAQIIAPKSKYERLATDADTRVANLYSMRQQLDDAQNADPVVPAELNRISTLISSQLKIPLLITALDIQTANTDHTTVATTLTTISTANPSISTWVATCI